MDSTNGLQWLAGPLAVAVALVVMQATKTTHPPAGTTALLPSVDLAVWTLGWYYIAVVLLSSTIILVTALAMNNGQRQYPKYWVYSSRTARPPLTTAQTTPVFGKEDHSFAMPASPETVPKPVPFNPFEPTSAPMTDPTAPRSLSCPEPIESKLNDEEDEEALPKRRSRSSSDSSHSSGRSSRSSSTDKPNNTQIIVWAPGKVRWTRAEDQTLLRLIKEGKSIDEVALRISWEESGFGIPEDLHGT